MQRITAWLESVGLSEYVNLFIKNNIDVDVLPDLTDHDLETIGVLLGHRKKILRAIAALHEPALNSPQFPPSEAQRDEAQRRQLTMMFCDLVGSTRLSLQLDPEDLGEVIDAYQSACSSVISTYDGFIARFIGDGILAYFGYPAAHEDDAERAVRAGLEIIVAMERITTRSGAKLQVRIGIATGLVVVGELVGRNPSEKQLAVGETPSLTARLQGVADPGTVVIATSTRRLLGDLFRVRDLGSHEVKGSSQPVRAWAVDGLSASEIRFEAVHPVHLTGFVGREEEIGLLLDCKNLAWKGEGQMVLISANRALASRALRCNSANVSRHRPTRDCVINARPTTAAVPSIPSSLSSNARPRSSRTTRPSGGSTSLKLSSQRGRCAFRPWHRSLQRCSRYRLAGAIRLSR